MEIYDILKNSYGEELTQVILKSYEDIEKNFVLKKWKTSELDAGHFVEGTRRILEFEFTGSYTPIGTPLSNFNNKVLDSYENNPGFDDSFRFHIPRILISIYKMRSKRGIGHLGKIDANEMDCTYIFHSVKWVLAEIIRIKSPSTLNFEKVQSIINRITERNIDLIWKEDGEDIILNPKLPINDQVLVTLCQAPRTLEELKRAVHYKNPSRFVNEILKKLEDAVYIKKIGDKYKVSPTGNKIAEQVILENSLIGD